MDSDNTHGSLNGLALQSETKSNKTRVDMTTVTERRQLEEAW